jgi:hypothetical protein
MGLHVLHGGQPPDLGQLIGALPSVLVGIVPCSSSAPGEELSFGRAPAHPHTVTADDGSFDRRLLRGTDTFQRTFDAAGVQDGMVFLLDHLPPGLHLVIASRADPTLPLARLRARGELVEIRAADLRFTLDEAAAYLHETMGLDLTALDVAALEGRTEGWVAALQLAALSMQGRDDVAGFIAAFAGDDRYIVDYLVEEVLQRQHEPVRSFLQQTSILDRLSGPLCDALTGEDSGKAMLEALERTNLFVVPLDDRRRWYRYHHLFADVLRARLQDEQPEQVPELHRRASAWYERNGEASEAIRHALAAQDFPKAAYLIELAMPEMRRSRQEATLLSWLRARCPRSWSASGLCSALTMQGCCWLPAGSMGSRAACGTPSGGWTHYASLAAHFGSPRIRRPIWLTWVSNRTPVRLKWSSWTKRNSDASRVRSPCGVPDMPWFWATSSRDRSPCAAGARPPP